MRFMTSSTGKSPFAIIWQLLWCAFLTTWSKCHLEFGRSCHAILGFELHPRSSMMQVREWIKSVSTARQLRPPISSNTPNPSAESYMEAPLLPVLTLSSSCRIPSVQERDPLSSPISRYLSDIHDPLRSRHSSRGCHQEAPLGNCSTS